MSNLKNPLNDREFLKKLDKNRTRETYVRITLLTFEEYPIEYIEGVITGGTINIDGASAVRRTCNLTMVTNSLNVNLLVLGLERKFKLEIGLLNTVDSTYPNIIWFNQGLFVTTGISTATQVSNFNISISGKDKMCLLNGDVGGSLPSSVDFGTIETISEDGKTITYEDLEIKDIIYHAVETYGNEQPHNIIINDLEELGLQLLEYKGDSPMYIFRDSKSNSFLNFTLNENQEVYLDSSKGVKVGKIENYDTLLENLSDETPKPTMVALKQGEESKYTVVKAIYGDTVGYRETPLTYAGDLIANVGETLTSVLDKIKNMLGNYEYFYDIDGRFVFQKKPSYISEPWAPTGKDISGTKYYLNSALHNSIFYSFEDCELVTNISNNSNIGNIKNDYSIWGVREGISGAEIPIHLRYAIDQKPQAYRTYKGNLIFVASDEYKIEEYDKTLSIINCDWREIIYQMAFDYFKYRDIEKDFYSIVARNNNQTLIINNREINLITCPLGKTGYEQYYTDIQGFWRSLYSPFGFYQQVLLSEKTYKKNKYYIKSYKDKEKRFPVYTLQSSRKFDDSLIYYELIEEVEDDKKPFNSFITYQPNQINFWMEFHDAKDELSKFSVRAIGQRSKNVNDNKITSIYYRATPNLIFSSKDINYEDQYSAYTYVKTSTALENCLAVSSQGKNAWDEAFVFLNENTCLLEQLSLTTLPVYYLQPNVRIGIKDSASKTDGEYLLNKITLPLTYNGTMNLSVSKIYDDIY